MIIKNHRVRAWVYSIATAGFGILTVYGIVNAAQAGAWLLLVSAVVGGGTTALARVNVSKPVASDASIGDATVSAFDAELDELNQQVELDKDTNRKL